MIKSVCKRQEDKQFFNFIHPNNIQNVKPSDFKQMKTERHLVFTNAKRKIINDDQMKIFMEKKKKNLNKAYKIEARKTDTNSQTVYLYKDMPIIAKSNNKHYQLANNDTFYIEKIATNKQDGLKYIHICPEIVSNTSQPILATDFQRLFRVAFAMTVHSSQGSTFDFPYTIHEWAKYTNEMKYVSLSRCTKKEQITIK
jgi:ATP-dependent exoDNAse (exonuclease V) alpha subunit